MEVNILCLEFLYSFVSEWVIVFNWLRSTWQLYLPPILCRYGVLYASAACCLIGSLARNTFSSLPLFSEWIVVVLGFWLFFAVDLARAIVFMASLGTLGFMREYTFRRYIYIWIIFPRRFLILVLPLGIQPLISM